METLIQLLTRYNSVLLFVFLQIVCFILIISFNPQQSRIYDATAIAVSGLTYDIRDRITKPFVISGQLDELIEDNEELFNRLETSKFNNILDLDTTGNSSSGYLKQYSYTGAKVVNQTTNNADNYITINRGKKHQVEKHQGVVGHDGIVGIVMEVSEHYARVMSVLHQQAKISVTIKNKGYLGSLVWGNSGSRYMQLQAIPIYADSIFVGDTIATSGYSSIFPSNLTVGTIDEMRKESGSAFYNIKVKLSQDMNRLRYVYVIKNKYREEQIELEEKVGNE